MNARWQLRSWSEGREKVSRVSTIVKRIDGWEEAKAETDEGTKDAIYYPQIGPLLHCSLSMFTRDEVWLGPSHRRQMRKQSSVNSPSQQASHSRIEG